MILPIASSSQEQKGIAILDTGVSDNNPTEINRHISVDKSLQWGKKTQPGEICAKREKGYLMSRSTAQRMIQRLLVENKMPKEKLAKILAVRKKQVEYFAARKGSEKIRAKINLPLIQLYCKTRWK